MRIFSLRRILILVSVLIVLALLGFHWYVLRQFSIAYDEYLLAAAQHDEVASIPALPENPLRRDLNQALADVLTETTSPVDRVARAEEGLTLLVLANGAIDAIGEVGEDTMEAVIRMEETRSLASFAPTLQSTLIEHARRRLDIIADIRGLSYRANHHTQEIFERVIEEKGELTNAHAREIDRLIPDVEEQFNRRSNLYAELAEERRLLQGAGKALTSRW